MKKCITLILLLLASFITSIFSTACNKSTYTLKYGAYGFETAILTNRITKEVTEKSFDDILDDNDEFKNWGNLLNFQILINEDTEYFHKENNTYFVLNEGLAFEIIDDNKLSLHFPHWNGYDFNSYDIVIILGWQLLYG